MARCPLKEAYNRQKLHAKRRGIPFEIPFDQWVDWWGSDIEKRGRGDGKLQMCRFEDCGPYRIDNIYKGTHNSNSSLKFELGFIAKKRYLTDDSVKEVKKLLTEGVSTRKVAAIIGTNQKTVMRIKHDKYTH